MVPACARTSKTQLLWALAFAGNMVASTVALAFLHPPGIVKYLLCALPIAVGILYLRAFVNDMRQLDELQRRIYLETAAVTCGGMFILALVYPCFEKAGILKGLEYWMVLAAMGALGVGGYIWAKARYR